MTQCTRQTLEFQRLGRRKVTARFDTPAITSDAGGLLLREIDAAAGCVKQLDRIVRQIRQTWPQVQIVVRGDSGFCREELMRWCETNDVQYVLGLAKNQRLNSILSAELQQARQLFESRGMAARVYKDFHYQTRTSWSRRRRVIGKAEHLAKGPNPRFVVTNLSADQYDAVQVYEKEYCGRGDMENRIKEQQLYSVCRSHQCFDHACQSVATVVIERRLCDRQCVARSRFAWDGIRESPMPHDPAQTVQNRSRHSYHRAPRVGLPFHQLSVR